MKRRRKFWGWGWEDEGPSKEQQDGIAGLLATRFGVTDISIAEAPRLSEIELRRPRVRPPDSLQGICSADPYERAGHSYGKSFRDVVRAFERRFRNPPDLVAFPRGEGDIVSLLDWCADAGLAAVPYGGGSSVVGGVEPPVDAGYAGVVSIDLRHLDRVLDVDSTSRAARIQAGIYGPALEDQLRPHGYTLRHFPQSFEFSTLGGWIATRSGGHFATLYTHIDDFVESLRVVSPAGTLVTRRLPGSGAGPSPDRLFIGSEGILGIITEAWMRLQERPRFRATVAVTFDDFQAAVAATRALSQSGLYPSNCRLLDPLEAMTSGAGTGSESVLLVAFESADHPVDAWMQRALECCRDHSATVPPEGPRIVTPQSAARPSTDEGGAANAWRRAFLAAPYLRDTLVAMGMISETFESAVTWDKFGDFHEGVTAAVRDALDSVCGGGHLTCRFTHVYPDGPAPYFTILAPARKGSQLAQWTEIKAAAAAAVLRYGGTITHHHAVGRDHRAWYEQQRPALFGAALAAAKAALDPGAILNPGVLLDPETASATARLNPETER
jgi:alkyldihydroxyacetonephosphate synthase